VTSSARRRRARRRPNAGEGQRHRGDGRPRHQDRSPPIGGMPGVASTMSWRSSRGLRARDALWPRRRPARRPPSSSSFRTTRLPTRRWRLRRAGRDRQIAASADVASGAETPLAPTSAGAPTDAPTATRPDGATGPGPRSGRPDSGPRGTPRPDDPRPPRRPRAHRRRPVAASCGSFTVAAGGGRGARLVGLARLAARARSASARPSPSGRGGGRSSSPAHRWATPPRLARSRSRDRLSSALELAVAEPTLADRRPSEGRPRRPRPTRPPS
jgi:hypothetical protein